MTTFRLSPNSTATTSTSNMMIDEHHHNKMKRQKKSSEDGLVVDNNKPKRKRISPEQFCLLTELFQQTDTPSHELRERLAKKLDMTNREVQVWFQNRRAKVNRTRLQEQEEQISNMMSKKVKFNYWSTVNIATTTNQQSTTNTTTTTTSSSSSSSSLTSSPSLLPHDLIFHPDVTPIDILATAAAYVQQWDEDEQQRKRKQQVIIQQREEEVVVVQPKKKSWRPWL